MEKAIYFDMDGTIADLYGVKNWLSALCAERVEPYIHARPLVDMVELSKTLCKLRNNGYHIGVVSWTAKDGSAEYNARVAEAKKFWLSQNVYCHIDEVKIVPYGTPKQNVVEYPRGIIFDDDCGVREYWNGTAYNVDNIVEMLKVL